MKPGYFKVNFLEDFPFIFEITFGFLGEYSK